MARALRVEYPGARYHLMCRENQRRDIFEHQEDVDLFIRCLGEMCARNQTVVHAWCLMSNHYHLLLETPQGNLVDAMKWFQGTFTQRYNARHQLWGHLFQGRFKGILVDPDESWLLDLSLYVHLNPVRVQRLGLDKRSRKAEVVEERLSVLRAFRWSSYPYYAGYKAGIPEWLAVRPIRRMVESADAYRGMAEARIVNGISEDFLSRLRDSVALGGVRFMELIRGMCPDDCKHEGLRQLRKRCDWDTVVKAIEDCKGCNWSEFSKLRGDWGRPAAYYLARKHGGMTLVEIGEIAEGANYPSVGQMVKRFEKLLKSNTSLQRLVGRMEQMLNVQT